MIPATRRRLERTLVSVSRQSLPRPARLYSSPSKPANAPTHQTATGSSSQEYPPFMPPPKKSEVLSTTSPVYHDMQGFLRQRTPYTILPTPLPSDVSSSTLNDLYFPNTPTQSSIAIIDACLHNLYDVPRAREVFELLRKSKPGDPVLEPRLYNLLLDAYIEMATVKDKERRSHWVEDAYILFKDMEIGKDKVHPTAHTYASMLRCWIRFNPDSSTPLSSSLQLPTPTELLRSIIDKHIPVSLIVADRSFGNSDEAAEVIKLLSKAAVEMNLSKIVGELGLAEILGSTIPDPLMEVPEAVPVVKAKVKQPDVHVTHGPDGSIVDVSAETEGAVEPEIEYEVPFNLENLRKHLAQVVLARRVLPEDSAARQKLLEESVYDVAVERLKHQSEVFDKIGLTDRGLGHMDLRKWMWEWHQKLQRRLKAEITNVIEEESRLSEAKINSRLGPFLSLIKPEKLSMITILELMHLHGSGGVSDGMKTARAILSVGKAVEMEYKAEMCKKNNISFFPTSSASSPAASLSTSGGNGGDHAFFSGLGYRDLHARRVAARKYMEDAEEWTAEWTQVVRVRVGSFLIDSLMDVATVTRTGFDKRSGESVSEEQPAFFHTYEYLRGQKLGIIKLNSVVAERISKDSVKETLHPRHLPMLVKPKPWLNHDEGGYLYNKTSVMRYKDCQEQQSYLRQASTLGNVELVFAGLDVLGSTPWTINKSIFDVVLQVWNSGEKMLKIPAAVHDEPEPPKPENVDTDRKVKMVYTMQMRDWALRKASNHSDRCSINYKIEIARTFLGDTIYMPHNVDFRGRAYPIPPHLNHIGNDLSRGLLKFAESKELGERGLRWLKIHLANLYGYDKASFDERVQFVHDHLEDIYDSATKPLEGNRWWMKADDPWQCLATCMELREALESPNPLEYKSNLPVHQDGTCNGLQHYAALGGDDRGAKQVNLDVTDRPSDVYTYVANMVEEQILKDEAAGNEMAKLLKGKIARKVVKQTVMTTVYGVTFIGAREQIEKQLKDRGDIPTEKTWLAASYLAKAVLSCIGNLFTGAKDIQTWLNYSARLISKSVPPDRIVSAVEADARESKKVKKAPAANRVKKEQMTSVVWTTPLGLPIVQPYRQTKRKQIMTSLQTVYISDPMMPAAVNSTKQASAFPPNFIHSLDATHMMLTALECRTQDITFASVHDSYWTHACTVDSMSGIIRDTFIALHSSDVLKKLYDEFKERYKGYKVPVDSIRHGAFLEKLGQLSRTATGSDGSDASDLAKGKDILELSTTTSSSSKSSESKPLVIPIQKRKRRTKAEVVALVHQKANSKGRAKTKAKGTGEGEGEAEEEGEGEAEVSGTGEDVSFVELVDILPPLPKKGQFDVKTIKGSLYFFS